MKPSRLNLSLALLIALLTAVSSPAQTATPSSTNAPAKERFLVIVETSTTMQKRTNNTERALGSIISTGLKGQIESGCTIGLWTFNEKLHTGQVPLQLWTDASRQHVALALVQAVQRQKYEKTGKLGVAWTVATNIVAQSERLTLLIFSSGSEPVTGTPYDAAIAASFSQNSEQQRKANMPFLTILRTVNGKFVASAVNMPPWPLEVPEWPDEFKPQPAPPEPEIAPAVVTRPPVGKRADPAVLSPTNTIYLVEPAPPIEVAEAATTLPPPPQLQPTNPVVAAPQIIEPPLSNPPAVTAPVEIKPGPAARAAELPKAKQPIVTLLIVGICVLLGVLVLIIALLRRRSASESLITRSMHRDDR